MKNLFFLFIFTLFIHPLFANDQVDCAKKKRDMNTLCGSLIRHCDYIQSCLIRRDTCVEAAPTDEQSCMRLHECSKKIEPQMPRAQRCEYEWSTAGNTPLCHVKKSIRFIEEACPGNIEGFFNAIAYGLRGTVDSKFNCSAAKVRYQRKMEYCEEAREEFDELCSETVEDELAYIEAEPKKCAEFKDIDNYVPGQFFLDIDGINKVTKNRAATGSSLKVETPEIRVLK